MIIIIMWIIIVIIKTMFWFFLHSIIKIIFQVESKDLTMV